MLDNITGEVRVFANEVTVGKGKDKTTKLIWNVQAGSRCTDVKKKEWLNWYVNVNFSKTLEEEVTELITDKKNYVDLIIKDAWFSCYKSTKYDDKIEPILFINKAKVVK